MAAPATPIATPRPHAATRRRPRSSRGSLPGTAPPSACHARCGRHAGQSAGTRYSQQARGTNSRHMAKTAGPWYS
eukprot:365498-Chlamydomonas_euryale.AAC.12